MIFTSSMKQLLAVALTALFFIPTARAERRLVWSQEFNTDGPVDTLVWNFETGFKRNHEDQWYQRENAFCSDGCLVIEARRDTRPNPLFEEGSKDWRRERPEIQYTSASVNTRGRYEFRYGTMEVRARIPLSSGAWPAIWTLGGGDLPWPSCGEIDVMEYYRKKGGPHILANAAWGTDRPYLARWNSRAIPFSHFTDRDPHWGDKFHVWTMEWTPESLRILLDGELLNEVSLSETINGSIGHGSNPMQQPHYILLNLALGGDNGGPIDPAAFPMRYEIDYVRVYQ